MTIRNPEKLNFKGYLTTRDVYDGDCFKFLNDSSSILYMRAGDYFVNIVTGEIFDSVYEEEDPVELVNVEIVIM